jgi:hypothetical protein
MRSTWGPSSGIRRGPLEPSGRNPYPRLGSVGAFGARRGHYPTDGRICSSSAEWETAPDQRIPTPPSSFGGASFR